MFRPAGKTRSSLLAILCVASFVGSSIRPAQADESTSPVVVAAKSGDAATLNRLLDDGADPNSHDADALTALNWAAYNGYLAAVQILIQHHANIDSHGNQRQWTPLMNAAAEGHIDVVSFLVGHGADVNAHSSDGLSSLDYAILKNHAKTAAFLKSHGAKATSATAAPNPIAQALCNAGTSADFSASDLAWHKYDKDPRQYFCQAITHDFPGGAGNVLMYTYEVDGDASGAKTIWITADIYDDQLPKDVLEKTLQPLLGAIFSAVGKGAVPDDVAAQVASISEFKSDTPVGAMAAHFTMGKDAAYPYIGSKYEITIQYAQ
jgi:uncharacterized protein